MYDRRYPHMEPIDRAVIDCADPEAVRAAAGDVARRTGTHAFYDRLNRKVFFSVKADMSDGGPLSVEVKACRSDRVEAMVEWIRFGQVEKKVKDRWAELAAAEEKYRRESAIAQLLAERRPESLAYAAFLDRRRRGMSRIISA